MQAARPIKHSNFCQNGKKKYSQYQQEILIPKYHLSDNRNKFLVCYQREFLSNQIEMNILVHIKTIHSVERDQIYRGK